MEIIFEYFGVNTIDKLWETYPKNNALLENKILLDYKKNLVDEYQSKIKNSVIPEIEIRQSTIVELERSFAAENENKKLLPSSFIYMIGKEVAETGLIYKNNDYFNLYGIFERVFDLRDFRNYRQENQELFNNKIAYFGREDAPKTYNEWHKFFETTMVPLYMSNFFKSFVRGYCETYFYNYIKQYTVENSETIIDRSVTKLKWNGTPSQFGFILLELIDKGYIEKPAKGYRKTAEILLSHFDIDTTVGTLEKEINPNGNSMALESYTQIKIPNIGKLKTKK